MTTLAPVAEGTVGVTSPMPTVPRVVGIDLSLASTGIATNTGVDRLRSTGHKTDTVVQRARRLHDIRNGVLAYCNKADLVVIEGASYASQTGSQHERAGLWWMIVDRLIANGIPVAVVPPANRMKYTVGKGGGKDASKDACLAATVKRFPMFDVTGNDIADAVILHAMGLDWLGWPLVLMPDLHRVALKACSWPELVAQ